MKIKTHKNDTYSIKGLDIEHLEVIYSLLHYTVLGTGGYSSKAADLAILLEKFGVVPVCNIELTGTEITLA
jgi:hypothetical protein